MSNRARSCTCFNAVKNPEHLERGGTCVIRKHCKTGRVVAVAVAVLNHRPCMEAVTTWAGHCGYYRYYITKVRVHIVQCNVHCALCRQEHCPWLIPVGKLNSTHRAGGPTSYTGWVPPARWVGVAAASPCDIRL